MSDLIHPADSQDIILRKFAIAHANCIFPADDGRTVVEVAQEVYDFLTEEFDDWGEGEWIEIEGAALWKPYTEEFTVNPNQCNAETTTPDPVDEAIDTDVVATLLGIVDELFGPVLAEKVIASTIDSLFSPVLKKVSDLFSG